MSGTCLCGCGQRTAIRTAHGPKAGLPRDFVAGHHIRATQKPSTERFWAQVEKTDGCWFWLGDLRKGYGRFSENKRSVIAHRWSYESEVGPIPDDLTVDHLCFERRCVRPDHLELVTRGENARRGQRSIRTNTCKQGHEFSPDNTLWSQGRRRCRACNIETLRKMRLRAKGVAA